MKAVDEVGMAHTDLAIHVERTLRALLDRRAVHAFLYKTTDKQRTREVKDELQRLGTTLGFKVAASGCQADEGEWLYDMIWYELSNDKIWYRWQAMVLECEWKMGVPVAQNADVDGDFQKLVQARADVRVWISTAANSDLANKHIENCKKQIVEFSATVPNDKYLFAVLIWSDSSYRIEQFSA